MNYKKTEQSIPMNNFHSYYQPLDQLHKRQLALNYTFSDIGVYDPFSYDPDLYGEGSTKYGPGAKNNTSASNNSTYEESAKTTMDISFLLPLLVSAGIVIFLLMACLVFIKLLKVYISKKRLLAQIHHMNNQSGMNRNPSDHFNTLQPSLPRNQSLRQQQQEHLNNQIASVLPLPNQLHNNFFQEISRNRSNIPTGLNQAQMDQLIMQQYIEQSIQDANSTQNQRNKPRQNRGNINNNQQRTAFDLNGYAVIVLQSERELNRQLNPDRVVAFDQASRNLHSNSNLLQQQQQYLPLLVSGQSPSNVGSPSRSLRNQLGVQNNYASSDYGISDVSNTDNDDPNLRQTEQAQPVTQTGIKPIQLDKKKRKKLDKLMIAFTMKGEFDKGFAEFGENTCCICFDDYETEKIIRKINRCGHIFHQVCLENWIGNKIREPKCPLCNLNIKFEDEIEN
eukprot:403335063